MVSSQQRELSKEEKLAAAAMVSSRQREIRKKEKLTAAATASYQSLLPEQKTDPPKRYIPPEILEQILLNLPIKSLLRFSCASTSWNSTITSPQFIAKRDCLRKTVIINDNPSYFDVQNAFCCPLSAVSDNPVVNATSSLPVCPFRGPVKLEAFCDQLWCVLVDNSLYLWDPSTGACKKLPDSTPLHTDGFENRGVVKVAYGLGYDAVEDDYKLLKILNFWRGTCSFLYSLRKGFWRKIDSRLRYNNFPNSNGLCVNGALNWMIEIGLISEILTFKFSSEKYGFLSLSRDADAYSHYDLFFSGTNGPFSDVSVEDIVVLRSKLCVYVNYGRNYEHSTALGLWAMEEYGVFESWTKLYAIRYQSIAPIVRGTTLRPLYLYEDGRVVIRASSGKWGIFVYKDMKVVARSKIVPRSKNLALELDDEEEEPGSFGHMMEDYHPRVCGGFVYVESLASSMKLAALLGK